jgi:hypothetical protein
MNSRNVASKNSELPNIAQALEPQSSIAQKLTTELDEALRLLGEYRSVSDTQNSGEAASFSSSLLQQCLALCEDHSAAQPEPIRTVHHFACTGGTLISKCIASMPNVQLLSEVDPLSTPVKQPPRPQFAPTDMITLMRQSPRGATAEQLIEIFLGELRIIYSHTNQDGLRLVLRDHAHSHYCRGTEIPERPSLREMVAGEFPILSVVTVRDPVDSYLSLKANGWIHFLPATFDEYCRRYLAFLHAYENEPIVRFEDFVANPEFEMARICRILDMPLNPDFQNLFAVQRLTGDSGRSGMSIDNRPRRHVNTELAAEIEPSTKYGELREILGYKRI